MKISFMNSYENSINSLTAFYNSLYPKWKQWLFYRSVFISILLSIALLYIQHLDESGVVINGIYKEKESLIFNMCWVIPIAIVIGVAIYKFSLVSRKNAILSQLEGLPTGYFGEILFSLDEDGATIQAPYYQVKYDWKMIDSIRVNQEYIFFCRGRFLVFSIPISALSSQQSAFIAKAEMLISNK